MAKGRAQKHPAGEAAVASGLTNSLEPCWKTFYGVIILIITSDSPPPSSLGWAWVIYRLVSDVNYAVIDVNYGVSDGQNRR